MAFARKLLNFSISLQNGMFGSGQGNTADLKGLRASCRIVKAGGRDMGRLEAAIFGLPLSMMNQLTTLGTQIDLTEKNSITVTAGEEGGSMSTVFAGTISVAFADMKAMPEVCLRVSAHAGLYEAVKQEQPTSIKDSADVKTVFGQLAQKMGLRFEGNDVDVKIPNLYLSGSARSQAMALAQMAGVQWIIDNGTLAIWKSGSARQGNSTPLISPQTGMVGYPAFNQAGIEVTTIFNSDLKPGGKIQVKSDLTPACGEWHIMSLEYALDSMIPKGKWFCIFSASRLMGAQPAGGF